MLILYHDFIKLMFSANFERFHGHKWTQIKDNVRISLIEAEYQEYIKYTRCPHPHVSTSEWVSVRVAQVALTVRPGLQLLINALWSGISQTPMSSPPDDILISHSHNQNLFSNYHCTYCFCQQISYLRIISSHVLLYSLSSCF